MQRRPMAAIIALVFAVPLPSSARVWSRSGALSDVVARSELVIFAERYHVLEHGLAPGFFTRLRDVFESGRVPVGLKHPARAGALEDAIAHGTGKPLVG